MSLSQNASRSVPSDRPATRIHFAVDPAAMDAVGRVEAVAVILAAGLLRLPVTMGASEQSVPAEPLKLDTTIPFIPSPALLNTPTP